MTAQAIVRHSRRAPDCFVHTMAALFIEMEEWPAQIEQKFLKHWLKRQRHRDQRGAEGCSNTFSYLVEMVFAVVRTSMKLMLYARMFVASEPSQCRACVLWADVTLAQETERGSIHEEMQNHWWPSIVLDHLEVHE